jgi:hypothetical protein
MAWQAAVLRGSGWKNPGELPLSMDKVLCGVKVSQAGAGVPLARYGSGNIAVLPGVCSLAKEMWTPHQLAASQGSFCSTLVFGIGECLKVETITLSPKLWGLGATCPGPQLCFALSMVLTGHSLHSSPQIRLPSQFPPAMPFLFIFSL